MAEERPHPRNLPSDELICLPFLDTDTTKEIVVADAELEARGYPGWLVRILRGAARPGLYVWRDLERRGSWRLLWLDPDRRYGALRVELVTNDAAGMKEALVSGARSPIDYGEIPKPAEILEEDKEIEVYPLRIEEGNVEIVPVDRMFAE